MNKYQVEGSYKKDKSFQNFKKTVKSNNEKNAVEKTYSLLGSEHGLKRNQIKISGVKQKRGE